MSSRLYYGGEEGSFGSLGLQKGDLIEVSEASFSAEGYEPLLVVAVWQADQQEPLYLVNNLELAEEAIGQKAVGQIHRTDCNNWSLFTLSKRCLTYLLNEE